MKMKNRYIVSSFVALAVLFSCVPDHRDFNMPGASVYFSENSANNGVQSVLMYDVQSEVETPVYVHCSGLKGGSTKVTAHVAEDYIAYYNELNYTELKALPEDCYTLVKSVDEVAGRNASFSLKFNVANIVDFAEQVGEDLKNYVVSLGLVSDNLPVATVKDTTSLGYYMVRPDLRVASVMVTSQSLPDNKLLLKLELPFENQWEFTYELDFNLSGTFGFSQSKGNLIPAKYVCVPAPADLLSQITVGEVAASTLSTFTIPAGSNTAEHVISVPSEYVKAGQREANNYAVGVKNVNLNGREITVEGNGHLIAAYGATGAVSAYADVQYSVNHGWYHAEGFLNEEADYYRHTLEPYGLEAYPESDHRGYTFSPESTQNGYHEERVFDGNGNAWYGAWNGDGYGYFGGNPDLLAIIDMKKVQLVAGAETWLRVDRWKGDINYIEFYALDKCTYEYKKGTMNYDENDVTYLGRVSGDYKHLFFCSFDPIETQYLLVNFKTRPGRESSFECTEIVLYH